MPFVADPCERDARRHVLYLSNLSSYVAALSGQLELRAVFPDEIVEIMPVVRS